MSDHRVTSERERVRQKRGATALLTASCEKSQNLTTGSVFLSEKKKKNHLLLTTGGVGRLLLLDMFGRELLGEKRGGGWHFQKS